MRKNPKNSSLILGAHGQRGAILMELVVASSIIAVVMAAIGFYFVYHVGTVDGGRAQLKLQRVGSLVMEEMARAIREGSTVMQANEQPMSVGVTYEDLRVTYPIASVKDPRCFSFDAVNKDIMEGPDENNLSPMELLDDSHTIGGETRIHRIECDGLGFRREGNRVTIQFTLTHDRGNDDTADDLTIHFGSAVKLRG